MSIGKLSYEWGLIKELVLDHPSREQGEEVKKDGKTVAIHVPEGFRKVSIYTPAKNSWGMSKGAIYKIALITNALNPEASFDDLVGFVCDVISNQMDRSFYRADRREIESLVDHAIDQGLELEDLAETRYYYWIAMGMSKEEKMQVVNKHRGKSLIAENIRRIDNAVDNIIEESERFITLKELAKETGLNKRTLLRRINKELSEKIGQYNADTFLTNTYAEYVRNNTVATIVGGIRNINEKNEKVTRVKVSKDTGLHYQTVKLRWKEKEVQDELQRYNEELAKDFTPVKS